MKLLLALSFLAFVAAGISGCVSSIGTAADLALTHVSVVDVENAHVLRDQTVLIARNRIVAVGPSARTRAADGAEVVEARGKYLIPGLWDMHVHSSTDRITRETFLPLYVANGVTGVRDMKGDCFDPCDGLEPTFEQVRQWREEIAAGTLVGPRIVASSPLIESPPPGQSSSEEAPVTEVEARALVRRMKSRGVDFIKVYSWLSRDAFVALADEAAQQGITFAGHVPVAVPASAVAAAGQRSIEHGHAIVHECSSREDELRDRLLAERAASSPTPAGTVLAWASESFSEAKCAALYDHFVRNDTWHVPTLLTEVNGGQWSADPRLRYVTADERDYWRETVQQDTVDFPLDTRSTMIARYGEIVGAMNRAGVRILAGSDVGTPFVFPGFGLHDELVLLVASGLSEGEALRAATLAPAEYLEAADSLGTIATGKLADLVLLDANPLEDIRNTQRIHAVVFNGHYFDRRALDQLLADVEAAANR